MLHKTPRASLQNGTHKSASKQGRKYVNKRRRTQALGTPLPRVAPPGTAGDWRLEGGPESTSEITGLLNSDDSRLEFAAPSPRYKIILKITFNWKAANCPLSGTRDRTTTAQHNTSHSLLPDSWPADQAMVLLHYKTSTSSLAEKREQSPREMSHLQTSAQSSTRCRVVQRQRRVLILTNVDTEDEHIIGDQREKRAAKETS